VRTPVVVIAGQGDTDAVTGTLLRRPGTLVVEHAFDGHVVRRRVISLTDGVLDTAETALELANGCVACTVRNDLLVLLRKLHRRDDVDRIAVRLAPWLEPEPICWAINHVKVRLGPGYLDGPAARDVSICAVVTCVDSQQWLTQALGDEEIADGRMVAQVVVGQAEFADVLVPTRAEPATLAVLRRLAPRARITVGADRVEMALAHVESDARRGRSDGPHAPLLAGEPVLGRDGAVQLVEFAAARPFHPQRLHAAFDLLLRGVVRTRGRIWLATQPAHVMWLQSAGGGLRIDGAGKWLAAVGPSELAYVDPERRAIANLMWSEDHGDRHTSMAILVCGADVDEITSALHGALLTDDEMGAPAEWIDYPDPLGEWHQDPCGDLADSAADETFPAGMPQRHDSEG
jgi:G3E family GTPase